MKKLIIILLIFPVAAYSQQVLRVLDNKLWLINGVDTVQVTGNIPTKEAGKILSNDGTNFTWITNPAPDTIWLASDVANADVVANTLSDVTGLSFPVTSGKSYWFQFNVVYTSAATTTGSRWVITGPTNTWLHYNSQYSLAATSITNNQGLSTYNVPTGVSASSLTASNEMQLTGKIKPSATGTIQLRFSSEITLSAITAKADRRSYLIYKEY